MHSKYLLKTYIHTREGCEIDYQICHIEDETPLDGNLEKWREGGIKKTMETIRTFLELKRNDEYLETIETNIRSVIDSKSPERIFRGNNPHIYQLTSDWQIKQGRLKAIHNGNSFKIYNFVFIKLFGDSGCELHLGNLISKKLYENLLRLETDEKIGKIISIDLKEKSKGSPRTIKNEYGQYYAACVAITNNGDFYVTENDCVPFKSDREHDFLRWQRLISWKTISNLQNFVYRGEGLIYRFNGYPYKFKDTDKYGDEVYLFKRDNTHIVEDINGNRLYSLSNMLEGKRNLVIPVSEFSYLMQLA